VGTAHITAPRPRTLPDAEVAELDPYAFFAVLGKRVIHPGGRTATERLIGRADFGPGQRVLDVGCGVATTAIEIARRFGATVTAVDIAPLMLERAAVNVSGSGLGEHAVVEHGDVCNLRFQDASFDRVVAEAVTMFVDRPRAARELVRVCRPGGRVLATEFYWRKPPTSEARQLFLGEVCPGLQFDSVEDWIQLYTAAGLTNVHVETGPFDMMTPGGFLHDEGVRNSVEVMARALSRLCYLRKLAWLVPRVARAVPYLGFILVDGTKPDSAAGV
jgi:SAM-dependent methyltransferase